MIWSLSVMMIARVFLPWVASISMLLSFASSLSLRMGAESGDRTATTFVAMTMLPYPIFTRLFSMRLLDILDLLPYLFQFSLDLHDIKEIAASIAFDAIVFTSRPIS